MKSNALIPVLLVLCWFFFTSLLGCAQLTAQGTKTGVPGQEGTKITVKGKIILTRSGYFLNGEVPPGRFIIENENTGVLEELAKRGQSITVEGRLPHGADYLFIERIEGQPYIGEK